MNTNVRTVPDSFAYPDFVSEPYSSVAFDPTLPNSTSKPPDPLLHAPTVPSSIIPISTSPNLVHTPVSLPSRKSTRTSDPPLWLADYVTKPTSTSTLYLLSNYVSIQIFHHLINTI